MYVMSTFYCIQKHDDVLKYGRKKYIIICYSYNSKYVKKLLTLFKITVSYSRFRAQIPNPVCETLIFHNLSTYISSIN